MFVLRLTIEASELYQTERESEISLFTVQGDEAKHCRALLCRQLAADVFTDTEEEEEY